MTSSKWSSLGSPTSSPRANTSYYATITSHNGATSWRGFLEVQNWSHGYFKVMLNELDVPTTDIWKYIAISGTISKNQDSHIQAAIDTLVSAKRIEMQGTAHKRLLQEYRSFDSAPIELVSSVSTSHAA